MHDFIRGSREPLAWSAKPRRRFNPAPGAIATDHERSDQEVVEQSPVDIFTVEILRAGADLDIGESSQAEHAETQDTGQEFRPQTGEVSQQSSTAPRGKILRQAYVENQSRHGDAEDSIAEGVSSRAFENMAFPAGLGRICAKTLSFFDACRARSIDFGQFAPIFRFDAARYRNAIS
jgi:hypothetical protein